VAAGNVAIASAFIAQLVGVVLIGGWTLTATAIIWYVFKMTGQARVSRSHEQEGLDVSEHGVETYPEFGSGQDTVVADGGEVRTDGGTVDMTEDDNE
jgi:Amt family ammonium transporter